MNIKLLGNKNFSLYIIGKLVSMLGSNMQQFALSLYVFAITGSATIFATMLSISILPRLLLSPIAGVFGDWFDRKKMIVKLDLFNGLLLSTFAVVFFMVGSLHLWMIFMIVILLEMTEIFYESSSAGIIPSIVNQEEMVEAKSMQTLVLSIGRLLSPMIAALVYGAFGIFIVLIINAISFIICGLAELFMKVPAFHKKPEKVNVKNFFIDLKEGLFIIRSNRFISSMIYLATAVNFVVGPLLYIGFIYLIIQVLEASEFQYGLFQSTVAFAMIIAPLTVANIMKKLDIAKICVFGITGVAIIFLIMSIIPSKMFLSQFSTNHVPFIALMVLSFLIGIIVTVINISVSAMFAKVVPIHAMGRTATVMNLLITISIPIGQVTIGFLLDTIATSYVIMMSGSILLLAVGLFGKNMLASTKPTPTQTETNTVRGGTLAHEV